MPRPQKTRLQNAIWFPLLDFIQFLVLCLRFLGGAFAPYFPSLATVAYVMTTHRVLVSLASDDTGVL